MKILAVHSTHISHKRVEIDYDRVVRRIIAEEKSIRNASGEEVLKHLERAINSIDISPALNFAHDGGDDGEQKFPVMFDINGNEVVETVKVSWETTIEDGEVEIESEVSEGELESPESQGGDD